MTRLQTGMSQREPAKRAGVPPSMISAYERDKRQPSLPTLMRLIEAAGLELRMRLEPINSADDPGNGRAIEGSPRDLQEQAAVWRDAASGDR